MNGVFITVQGVIGTDPKASVWNRQEILSFRMVCNERRYDGAAGGWIDVHSSWLQVSCFGPLARNVQASLHKGDRVLVHGKMRVKDYVTAEGVERTGVDLVADSIGPDLKFGIARVRPARRPEDAEERLREQADQLQRELDEEPRLTVAELVAHRTATADDFDDELDDLQAEGTDAGADDDRRPALAVAGR